MAMNELNSGRNLWRDTYTLPSPGPPLEGEISVDVAVIGAGYTGLSTAYHLKTADPALDVAVLEAGVIGQGASGRNGGFVMTLFGSSVPLMRLLHGKQKIKEAHDYMEKAIHALEDMVETHAIDCEYHRTGLLKVATTDAYARRTREEMEFLQSLGIGGMEWLDQSAIQGRVRSPGYVGGAFERDCGSLHPLKWTEGLARLARSAGAHIYEQSPVSTITRKAQGYVLTTPSGRVRAEKIVYAANGYTHLLPGMRFSQLPAFAYIVATDVLSGEQLASIGWQGREGIEDGRNFMHFYRLTADNRLIAGGGPGFVPFGRSMAHDTSAKAFAHLERFVVDTFPTLAGVQFTHRWGGAFSMTADFTPSIRMFDGGRAACAMGCTGHGVAMTHMNGRILSDLIRGQKTELTDLWFVNRRPMPVPPEPVRWLVTHTAMAAMSVDDWWCDRARK